MRERVRNTEQTFQLTTVTTLLEFKRALLYRDVLYDAIKFTS